MSMFPSLPISGSGVDAAQTWLDTTGANLANAADTVPIADAVYAEQTPVFTPEGGTGGAHGGTGVAVAGVNLGSNAGTVTYDPSSPLADGQGDVRVASVDTGTELTHLMEAQEMYQSNAASIQQATKAYEAALKIAP